MKQILTDKEIQHLYWRAGFGITQNELKSNRQLSKTDHISLLFSNSAAENFLKLDLSMFQKDMKLLTKEERMKLRKMGNSKLLEINKLWFDQMQVTKGILREKMTLFFQNHFSVRLRDPQLMLPFHNTIRKHALGNFGSMLMEVSKSPAMLKFLNARQNKKGSPNENFAREVMELFTLGRDNMYTEKDIQEAARGFTGWDYDENGSFFFKKGRHDSGMKAFLGESGNFTGEDVIEILLKQKQTARYLSKKLYAYFVNENTDTSIVEKIADLFYKSDYDISKVLQYIFSSDWFYQKKHIGIKIKAPVELIVGLGRQFKVEYEKPKALFFIQNKLNQVLFYPPNVAGWPGGRNWIDSDTLLTRLKLPTVLLLYGAIQPKDTNEPKNDETETMMGASYQHMNIKRIGLAKRVKAQGNWDYFVSSMESKELNTLVSFLIQPDLSATAKTVLREKPKSFKKLVVNILSLPEYQLC